MVGRLVRDGGRRERASARNLDRPPPSPHHITATLHQLGRLITQARCPVRRKSGSWWCRYHCPSRRRNSDSCRGTEDTAVRPYTGHCSEDMTWSQTRFPLFSNSFSVKPGSVTDRARARAITLNARDSRPRPTIGTIRADSPAVTAGARQLFAV